MGPHVIEREGGDNREHRKNRVGVGRLWYAVATAVGDVVAGSDHKNGTKESSTLEKHRGGAGGLDPWLCDGNGVTTVVMHHSGREDETR